jgi:large subunit ribosomal protein L29
VQFSEIKDLTVEELRKRLSQGRAELFEMKMKHAMGQVGSPITIRGKRRDLARFETALAQKLNQPSR